MSKTTLSHFIFTRTSTVCTPCLIQQVSLIDHNIKQVSNGILIQGDSQLLKFSALSYPHSKVILGYFPISWDTRFFSQYQHIRFATH